MTNWEYISLSEMSDSCLGKMLDKQKNVGHLHPYLSNKNVRWGSFDLDNLNLMRFKDMEFERYSLKDGDLVVCEGGEPGRCAIWKGQTSVMRIQKALHRVRVREGFDPYFLYYRFLLAGKSNGLSNHFIGSTIKHLTGVRLKKMEFQFPDYKTQTKISSILSGLDAKIELNNKINVELESMSKLIYDYWFIQFNFPNENGKPYKPCGGEMVYNKTLKRPIPEGWEVEKLSSCCKIIDCLHSKKSDYRFEREDYYLLQLENIGSDNLIDLSKKYYVSEEEYKRWTARIEVADGDLVITNAGRVAGLAQIPKNVVAGIGRNITAIRPQTIQPTFLYYTFHGAEMVRQIRLNTDTGSFFKSLNVRGIKELFVIRPPKYLEEEFERLSLENRRKREQNVIENQKLTELRDWLLPMLMNGQVTLGNTYEKEEDNLAVAAEPGVAYQNDKTAIDALFETINHDYEVAVIQLLTDRRFGFTYGKKYTHKMFSNIEMLNTMPKFKELAFEEKGWGMFSKAIAKTIDAQKFIYFHRLNHGAEVLKVKLTATKEITNWMARPENKSFISEVNHMLNLYEKPLIDKQMDRIELLNTVLDCMKVLETDDLRAIRNKMTIWKMEEEYNKTKAEKFTENETFHMIQFVKEVL